MDKPEETDVERALLVFVLDPKLRALLAEHDPQALCQALRALGYMPMAATSSASTNVARLRVPRFADAVVFTPEVPNWLQGELHDAFERKRPEWVRRYGDVLTLTSVEYAAFTRIGASWRGALHPLRCPKCGGPPLADAGQFLILCESCDEWYDIRTGQACEAPK